MLYLYTFRGLTKPPWHGEAVLPVAFTTMAGFGPLTIAMNGGGVGYSVLPVNGMGTWLITPILPILAIICLVRKGKIDKDKRGK